MALRDQLVGGFTVAALALAPAAAITLPPTQSFAQQATPVVYNAAPQELHIAGIEEPLLAYSTLGQARANGEIALEDGIVLFADEGNDFILVGLVAIRDRKDTNVAIIYDPPSQGMVGAMIDGGRVNTGDGTISRVPGEMHTMNAAHFVDDLGQSLGRLLRMKELAERHLVSSVETDPDLNPNG